MYRPIMNLDQLLVGGKLRKRIYGAAEAVIDETEYKIISKITRYALIEKISTLAGPINPDVRPVLTLPISDVILLQKDCFEVWIDVDRV